MMLGMSKASTAARARWARIIRAQRGSGLSIAAFCAGRGIAESSFYPWKRRLAAEGAAPPGAFVEARVAVSEARTDGPNAGVGNDGEHCGDAGGDVRNIGAREDGAGAGMTCRTGVAVELSHGRRVLVGRGFDRAVLLEVVETLEEHGRGRAAVDASGVHDQVRGGAS